MWGEPKRQTDLKLLAPYVEARVRKMFAAMVRRGYDPIAFETLRTEARQKWLYSIGRTRQKNRKPVTFTMHSKHFGGKAVDVISAKHGWNDSKFFKALKEEAAKVGLHTLDFEACHVEFRG